MFLPNRNSLPLSIDDMHSWYANLLAEMAEWAYSGEMLELLGDRRNYYGKYLDPRTRKFFLNHFAGNLMSSINYMFEITHPTPRVLEVGSGCGNQILLMALLGADVVGCDVRGDVCAMVERRRGYYERLSRRSLAISVVCDDVFNADWSAWGAFDSVTFLFSFNDIQPSEKLLELVKRVLKPGGRLVLQEINQSNYYNSLFRRRAVWKPREVAQWLEENAFRIDSFRGGYALPPVMWRYLPTNFLRSVDAFVRRSIVMSPSYHLMAEKQ